MERLIRIRTNPLNYTKLPIIEQEPNETLQSLGKDINRLSEKKSPYKF